MAKHDLKLDILRGVAASVVVWRHITGYTKDFHSVDFFPSFFSSYNPPAHLCVLVFFVLSGYVINMNTQRMSDLQSIAYYVKKRIIRIFPIYFLAILFTFFIAVGRYSVADLFSNMFFLSVLLDNVMVENSPLWSLQYEILYYCLFIFFSYYNVSLKRSLVILLSLILLMFLIHWHVIIHPLVISCLVGFCFWLFGAYLAHIKSGGEKAFTLSQMLSIVLLMFSVHYFNPYGPALKTIGEEEVVYHQYSWFQQSISFNDMFFLPFCILLIVILTNKRLPWFKFILWGVYVIVLIRILSICYLYGFSFFVENNYLIPTLIFFCSTSLWFLAFEIHSLVKRLIKTLSIAGNFSYAMYVFHLPILFCFGSIDYYSKSPSFFYFKISCYIITMLIVAFLVEFKFQEFVKNALISRNERRVMKRSDQDFNVSK